MIDDIDRRIIAALRNDGRDSHADLATTLGVSAATVAKRLDKMLGEGIITVRAILNPNKLGYTAHAFIALDVDLVNVDRICADLISNHNTSLVVTTFGRFDVILLADFPNWEMLQDYISKVLPRIPGIQKINTFPVVENKKIYNPLFKPGSNGNKAAEIDELDRKIIEELERNGRADFADIAKLLETSLSTGISMNAGSVIHVSRSVKAAFTASVIRW